MSLFNAFVAGTCTIATLNDIIHGDAAMAAICAALAILNLAVAIGSYRAERSA